MKKKNEWIKIRNGLGAKSKVEIEEKGGVKFDGEPQIEVFNHERIKISRFGELKDVSSNKATITLNFVSTRGVGTPNEKDDVEYWFPRLKPKDEAERKSFEKEAHADYLTKNGFLNQPKEFGGHAMTWELKGTDGKITLEIKEKDNNSSSLIKINHDNIEVIFDFFLTSKVNIKEVVEYGTSNKSPYFTKTRIILLSLAAIIILLIIYFRKKIWKWIKGGGTKQEKKVENQLDIF